MSVNPPGELPPDPPPDDPATRGDEEPEGPVEPGLGPPHMQRPHPHEHHGHEGHPGGEPHAPVEPGLGPPHEEMPEPPAPPIPPPPPPGPEPIPGGREPGQAPIEPGLGPPHMRRPEPHGHPGHPHHEGEPHAPIEPGLGPPHAEMPPLPPRPGEKSEGEEGESAPARGSPPRPDSYTPPNPPSLPPWLRAEPIGGAHSAIESDDAGRAAPGMAAEPAAPGAPAMFSAAAVAGAAAGEPSSFGEPAPPGSPGRVGGPYPEPFTPPAAAPTAAPPAPAGSEASLLAPAATTPAEPAPAPAAAPPAAPPRVFGEAMATGVLLTLAGGSAVVGGIVALSVTDAFGLAVKALISGGAAVVLLAGAVALRLVRDSDDLRGLLAVTGIGFAAACLAFAYSPADATDHDNLVKFALVAGLVAVLGWIAAVVVPSAVAGFLAVVALGTAVGLGVQLGLESPTRVEVYVAVLGIGIAAAALLPRLPVLRPHPTGLGWALAGAVLVMTFPAVELISRGDATALATGATAAAAMLVLATRHRHLPAALGALAGLGALEGYLVINYISLSSSGVDTTRLVVVAVAGAVLIALVAAGVLVTARGRALPRWPLPVGLAEILLAASLALAVVSLFTGPGDTPLNITIPSFSTSSSATHLPAATLHLA